MSRPVLFNQCVDALLGHLSDAENRKSALREAFHGNDRLTGLDCQGDAHVAVPRILNTLARYGKLNDGRRAINVFLDVMKQRVGADIQEQITRLQDAYSNEITLGGFYPGYWKWEWALIGLFVGVVIGTCLVLVGVDAAMLYRAFFPIPKVVPTTPEVVLAQAVEEFAPLSVCERAGDPNLPADIFGLNQDADGMPRQWMRLIDDGVLPDLETKSIETKRFWILTEPFECAYGKFDAYVYASIDDKVVVCAFLVRPDGPSKFIPLSRGPKLGKPEPYLFVVPESREGDRLLVFLAAKAASMGNVGPGQRFHIRSQALKPKP